MASAIFFAATPVAAIAAAPRAAPATVLAAFPCLSRLVALPTRTFAESVALLNRFFLAMLLTSRLSLTVTILSHCTCEPVARSVHGVHGPQRPTQVENQMFRPEPRERELSVH